MYAQDTMIVMADPIRLGAIIITIMHAHEKIRRTQAIAFCLTTDTIYTLQRQRMHGNSHVLGYTPCNS